MRLREESAQRDPRPRWFVIAANLLAVVIVTSLLWCGRAQADTGPWSEPIKVSGDTVGGWFPDVAADDFGNVHIVWNGGFPGQVMDDAVAAARPRLTLEPEATPVPVIAQVAPLFHVGRIGDSWSQPNDIALIWQGHALRSSVAVDRAGRVHLLYKGLGRLEPTESLNPPHSLGPEDLWYTSAAGPRANNVTSWSPPKRITRALQGYYCDIALDNRGVIHVIWTESSHGLWGIYYSNSPDSGATWSDRVALEGSEAVLWSRAQLKVDAQDRVHVVWELLGTEQTAANATGGVVYALSADGGKTWSHTRFREIYSGPGQQQPALGIDGQGNILMVFRELLSNRILYQQSSSGADWSQPIPLPGPLTGLARPFDVYDMVTDSAGHVHLAAVASLSADKTMHLLHLEWDGRSWSSPSIVANPPPFPEYPRLSVSNGNRLHLVWFGGDEAGVNRNPVGIWYSTASTSAPQVDGQTPLSLGGAENPRTTAVEPTPRPVELPIPDLSVARQVTSVNDNPDTAPRWLSEFRRNPIYPLAAGLLPLIPLVGVALLTISRLKMGR